MRLAKCIASLQDGCMTTFSRHFCTQASTDSTLHRSSLTGQNTATAEPHFFNEKSYCLVADSTIPELKILERNCSESSITRGLRRFRIKRNSSDGRSIAASHALGREVSGISLIIHAGLLHSGAQGHAIESTTDAVEISDGPIEELSMGLLLSDRDRQLGSDATTYAVGMLCDRLRSHLSEVTIPPSGQLQEWQISAIHAFLSSHLVAPISVSDLAKLCRLSSCQFSRLFKATYGSPFYQVVLHERVKRAMHSLRNSEAPLSEIALDCGFSDQSCFTRRFTMITGSSPGLWRKRFRKRIVFTGPPPADATIFAQRQA